MFEKNMTLMRPAKKFSILVSRAGEQRDSILKKQENLKTDSKLSHVLIRINQLKLVFLISKTTHQEMSKTCSLEI